MDNTQVIGNLKSVVNKLKDFIDRLNLIRNAMPDLTDEQNQRINELDSEITKMIAKKHALEVIINEREAADAAPIPPLSPDLVAQYNDQMNKLNVVIQADQQFDQIVAIAKGINSAAAEMEGTTKV